MNTKNKNLWLGMATVTPCDNNNDLSGARGAVCNVLYLANDKNDFEQKVREKLLKFGYIMENLEDIELFDFDASYQDKLNELAELAVSTKSFQWGTFYTYDEL